MLFRSVVHYAAFFASRGAVHKALGIEDSEKSLFDVEISHNEKGRPVVILSGKAKDSAAEQGIVEIQISLSYTHQMAVASAVAIKKESSPVKKESYDPMEELTRQFKELRTMLDDLEYPDEQEDEDKDQEEELVEQILQEGERDERADVHGF